MKIKYLTLIIEVFESIQPITESTIEIKRNVFRGKLLEVQTQNAQRGGLISKEDFWFNCENAVKELKKYVVDYIELIRQKKLSIHLAEITFGLRDKQLINYGNVDLNRKNEIESKTLAVNNLYGREYLVGINSLVKTAKNKMCLIDIEFIESACEKNNFIEPQQYKPVKPKKLTKTIFDFVFNVNNKELFMQDLKQAFPTEIGQTFSVIIGILEEESIFIIPANSFLNFFKELKELFSRDIGSRQSIQSSKFKDINSVVKEPIQKRLNPLIIKYKTK